MASLISLPAAKLSSSLSRTSALAMDVRVASAEVGTADLGPLIFAVSAATKAIESFEPETEDEFSQLARLALDVAEQVRMLTAAYPELVEVYESFALEAEDFALAAQFKPSRQDLEGARPLGDFR